MTVIGITSSRGSPGVSSLAVGLGFALVRRRLSPLVIEADPAGGVYGLRFNLPREPSLATLAGSAGRGSDVEELLDEHCVDLAGMSVLTAPFDGLVTTWALNRSTQYLTDVLRSLIRPVVIDLGRIDAGSAGLGMVPACDVVISVCRPTAEDAQSMMYGIRTLRNHTSSIGLVTVGDKPFVPQEIAELAGVPLMAVVPDDRRVAAALVGGRHSASAFRRSSLYRSIDSLGQTLFWPSRPAEAPTAARSAGSSSPSRPTSGALAPPSAHQPPPPTRSSVDLDAGADVPAVNGTRNGSPVRSRS